MQVKRDGSYVIKTFSSKYQQARGPSSAFAWTSIASSLGLREQITDTPLYEPTLQHSSRDNPFTNPSQSFWSAKHKVELRRNDQSRTAVLSLSPLFFTTEFQDVVMIYIEHLFIAHLLMLTSVSTIDGSSKRALMALFPSKSLAFDSVRKA
ncbi:hypothetical protein V6N13_075065 [Hibiscus sabdariffa]|uniref:Uncharacterized protein n=1 Tax=Hibiscus sabdariffa TaxID=183260 RepID=A0ABR2UAC5_9ROSI